ncbi:MAG: hypothetical protein R3F37_17810 [Candidatus Competibacteraceae bacterium]
MSDADRRDEIGRFGGQTGAVSAIRKHANNSSSSNKSWIPRPASSARFVRRNFPGGPTPCLLNWPAARAVVATFSIVRSAGRAVRFRGGRCLG